VTPGGLLARELRFRTLELRSVVAASVAAVAAIVVAALGFGAWAIVTQLVVEAGVGTALLWWSISWRPRFIFSRESLRSLAGVSGYIFGKGFFAYLHRNADNFLVGRFLGASKLGAYTIAYNVMQWPLLALAIPVWDVIFPAMAKVRDPKKIGDIWIRITRLAAMITAPAYFGMIVVAPEFVTVVFGRQWHQAIPVLRILCYVGFIQSLTILVGEILMVLDRAATLFWLSVGGAVLMVTAFALGLRWGILGVSSTYAAANTPVTALYAISAARATGVPMTDFLRSVRGIIAAAGVMAAVLVGARSLLIAEHLPPAARLAILIPVGFLVFVPLCMRGASDAVAEARDLLRHRGRPQPLIPEPAAFSEA
jgi:O-antigen/teichoic acid export membrane protein